jgi:hypothetical protein
MARFGYRSWLVDAREISTAFYLGNGPAQTPYTQLILPMATNVPCIRYAVGATASCHIGNRLQDNKLKMQSLHLRLEATRALRQQLTNDIEKTDISSIACMVLLAQLDVGAQIPSLQGYSNRCYSSALGTVWSLEHT